MSLPDHHNAEAVAQLFSNLVYRQRVLSVIPAQAGTQGTNGFRLSPERRIQSHFAPPGLMSY